MVEEPLFPPSEETALAIGARLRDRRKEMRLSLQAVEVMSEQEFKASVLAAYERGELGEWAISMPRLQRLANLYDIPVSLLLPSNPNE
jgi:transcriptional regulator with XRE-family HTH domain